VDVFPRETVLQDPVERWNTPQYQLLCLVHRGWQDYVTLHNIKLHCPAHGGWPNYVTLKSCSNKELLFKGLQVKWKLMQAHSIVFQSVINVPNNWFTRQQCELQFIQSHQNWNWQNQKR
jgi:hypothetical protein